MSEIARAGGVNIGLVRGTAGVRHTARWSSRRRPAMGRSRGEVVFRDLIERASVGVEQHCQAEEDIVQPELVS